MWGIYHPSKISINDRSYEDKSETGGNLRSQLTVSSTYSPVKFKLLAFFRIEIKLLKHREGEEIMHLIKTSLSKY